MSGAQARVASDLPAPIVGLAGCDAWGAVLLDHDADGPKHVSASSMASPIEQPRCCQMAFWLTSQASASLVSLPTIAAACLISVTVMAPAILSRSTPVNHDKRFFNNHNNTIQCRLYFSTLYGVD